MSISYYVVIALTLLSAAGGFSFGMYLRAKSNRKHNRTIVKLSEKLEDCSHDLLTEREKNKQLQFDYRKIEVEKLQMKESLGYLQGMVDDSGGGGDGKREERVLAIRRDYEDEINALLLKSEDAKKEINNLKDKIAEKDKKIANLDERLTENSERYVDNLSKLSTGSNGAVETNEEFVRLVSVVDVLKNEHNKIADTLNSLSLKCLAEIEASAFLKSKRIDEFRKLSDSCAEVIKHLNSENATLRSCRKYIQPCRENKPELQEIAKNMSNFYQSQSQESEGLNQILNAVSGMSMKIQKNYNALNMAVKDVESFAGKVINVQNSNGSRNGTSPNENSKIYFSYFQKIAEDLASIGKDYEWALKENNFFLNKIKALKTDKIKLSEKCDFAVIKIKSVLAKINDKLVPFFNMEEGDFDTSMRQEISIVFDSLKREYKNLEISFYDIFTINEGNNAAKSRLRGVYSHVIKNLKQDGQKLTSVSNNFDNINVAKLNKLLGKNNIITTGNENLDTKILQEKLSDLRQELEYHKRQSRQTPSTKTFAIESNDESLNLALRRVANFYEHGKKQINGSQTNGNNPPNSTALANHVEQMLEENKEFKYRILQTFNKINNSRNPDIEEEISDNLDFQECFDEINDFIITKLKSTDDQNPEIHQKIKSLNEEIKNLKVKISLLADEKNSLSVALEEKKDQLDEHKKKLKQKSEKISLLKEEILALKDLTSKNDKLLKSSLASMDASTAKEKLLSSQLESVKSDYSELAESKTELNEQFQELKAELHKTQSENADLASDLTEAHREVQKLSAELKLKEVDLEKFKSKITDLEAKEAKLKTLEKSSRNLEIELETFKNEVDNIKRSNQNFLPDKFTGIKYLKRLGKALNDNISTLEILEQENKKIPRLSKELLEKEEELIKANKRLNNLNMDFKLQSNKFDEQTLNLENKLYDLQQQNLVSEKEIEEQKELLQKNNKILKKYENELALMREKLEQSQKELKLKQKTISDLNLEIDQIQSRIFATSAKQKSGDLPESKRFSNIIEQQNFFINSLKHQLHKAKDETEHYRKKLDELNIQLLKRDGNLRDMADMEEQMEKLLNSDHANRNLIKDLQNQLQIKADELQESNKVIKNYKKILIDNKSKSANYENSIKDLRHKINHQNNSLDTLVKQLNILKTYAKNTDSRTALPAYKNIDKIYTNNIPQETQATSRYLDNSQQFTNNNRRENNQNNIVKDDTSKTAEPNQLNNYNENENNATQPSVKNNLYTEILLSKKS